jgi:hypothetical protein
VNAGQYFSDPSVSVQVFFTQQALHGLTNKYLSGFRLSARSADRTAV